MFFFLLATATYFQAGAMISVASLNCCLLISILVHQELLARGIRKNQHCPVSEKIDLPKMRELSNYLEQLEPTLSSFFLLSEDLFCIADNTGRFIKVNPSWKRTLGWEADEMTSQPYINFVHPDDVAATLEVANNQTKTPVARFRNRYRCKDGSYRRLSWVASAYTAEGNCYAVARDITENT